MIELPRLRRLGPTVAVTGASQAVSAIAVVLATTTLSAAMSDTFAVSLQTALAGLTGIVIGVIYNLAIGRPGFRLWTSSALLAALTSPIVAVMTYSLGTSERFGTSLFATDEQRGALALFALGGSALAFSATFSVRLACLGRPVWLAGATLAPNLALAVALAMRAFGLADLTPLTAAAVWAGAAMFMTAPVLAASRWARPVIISSGGEPVLLHAGFLLVGAVVSTLLPNLYLSAAARLSEGTAALIFLIGKVGTALVGLGVNSLLLGLYSWNSRPSGAAPLARIGSAGAAVTGAVAAAAQGALGLATAAGALVVLMWFTLLIAAAVALRELNSSRAVRAIGVKTGLDVLVSVPVAFVFLAHPSRTGYFGVYALSQAVTLGVFGAQLKDRLLLISAAASAAAALYAVLYGW